MVCARGGRAGTNPQHLETPLRRPNVGCGPEVMPMAQVGKGEFDRLRELLGMSERVPSGRRPVPSGRHARTEGILAGVAPWKLAVAGVLLVAAIGLLAVLLGAFDEPAIVLRQGARVGEDGAVTATQGVPVESDGPGAEAAIGVSTEERQPEIYVHVAGAVAAPGVYALPSGARVNDAVAAAGGLLGDAQPDALNLASPLADGAKVLVPRIGEAPLPGDSAQGAAERAPGVVNVNAAGTDELQILPGIGPSLASAIVEDREANGPFSNPEDLMRVSGIGEKKFARLAGLIAV